MDCNDKTALLQKNGNVGRNGSPPLVTFTNGTYGSMYGDPGTGYAPKVVIADTKRNLSFSENVERITLSWRDINVFVPPKTKLCCRGSDYAPVAKQIVNNVSGIVQPGTLLAVMGASGAGKSTLLNVLTYRNRGNLMIEGTVKVNGHPIGRGMNAISAYIQQDDLFVGTLKVREHLIFQARLRMDKHIPFKDRLERVEKVIEDLGLSKCADTKIGIPGRVKGISGGEMKRLAFASEILTNPPILFCDEPTSGLDSFMAESVVQTLKKMASKGKTIITTIHQPSSEVYALFDRVLLMAEGRLAYLGSTQGAFPFFESLNMPCPPNFNPADHFIHSMAIKPGQEYECRQLVEMICDNFAKSEYSKEVQELMDSNDSADSDIAFDDMMLTDRSPYKASWCQQFIAVLWRSWLTVIRDPMLSNVRIGQSIFIGLILGLIYLNQQYNQKGVMNMNGVLFLFLTNMSFSNMFAVVNVFPNELPIFRREHNNGMYRTDIYFLCKNLAEFPWFFVTPVIFASIVYWMAGLYNAADAFLICMGIMILVANCAVSFGYLLSTSTDSVSVALAVGPAIMIPFLLFGGFFLNNESIPVYFIWLKYLSWYQPANEMLAINQWRNVDYIECPNITMPTGAPLPSEAPSGGSRCFTNGDDVLESTGMNKDNFYTDLYILIALTVGYRLLAYIILLAKSYRKE